jgi:alanine racemase
MEGGKVVTRAVIHIDALRQNIAFVRSLAGERKILAPVKADGYGHGAVKIARAALEEGASHLGVARVSEAAELRAKGIDAPILLFSIPDPDEIPAAIEHDVTCFVPDIHFADMIHRCAEKNRKPASVHLKIDSGMGRIGIAVEEAPGLARFINEKKFLRLDGVCTHLSVSDSTAPPDIDYTKWQIMRFFRAVEEIKNLGINPGIVHAAASGGVLLYPESHFDMVRPGILLYGYPPSGALAEKAKVRPVMTMVTKVSFLKKVKKGEAISYGRRWTAPEDTVVATLPAGYADGLPRTASGKLFFVINGRRYPQVGTICMDQCMIDLGLNAPVRLWDDAIIFGGDSAGNTTPLTAASIAEITGTIPYEVLCGIGKRVPRVYTSTPNSLNNA